MRGYDRLEVDALLHDTADMIEARGVGVEALACRRRRAARRRRARRVDHQGRDRGRRASTSESAKRASELTQEAEQAAEHARREADAYATETRECRRPLRGRDPHRGRDAQRRACARRPTRMSEARPPPPRSRRRRSCARRRPSAIASRRRSPSCAQQRQSVIESIERLRGNLDSMVGGVEQGTEQFIALGGTLRRRRPVRSPARRSRADADEPLAPSRSTPGSCRSRSRSPMTRRRSSRMTSGHRRGGYEDDYEDEEEGESPARTRTGSLRDRGDEATRRRRPRTTRTIEDDGRGLDRRGRRGAGRLEDDATEVLEVREDERD